MSWSDSARRKADTETAPTGTRHVDELECVLSVLLAIAIARYVGAQNISWAAFSGYMVMRGHAADSFRRGAYRVLGTAFGAVLALLLVPVVAHSLPLCAFAAAAIGGGALYAALTQRHSYACFFLGLTFQMILLDQLEHPGDSVSTFALTRFLEVTSGTCACILVSTLSTLTLRRRWPGKRVNPAQGTGWHPFALRHALQGAVALGLLPPVSVWLGLHQMAQGAVSIICVMMVPVSSVGVSGLIPVSRKMVHRVIGCIGGVLMAGIVLLFAHNNPAFLLIGTVLGVIVGRHIENGGHAFTYVGTQFTLGVLIALVPDSYAAISIDPALDRLMCIILGMALIEPVLICWHVIARTPVFSPLQLLFRPDAMKEDHTTRQ